MVKQDLINLSPVRFFDDIADGGLKAGQLGLITAKKGLGKTSVLVQLGIDALIQDKQLVHVSFDQHSSNVISWYNSILAEIGKKKNLGDTSELNDSIVRERTILNFNQETFSMLKVVNTIKALKEGGNETLWYVHKKRIPDFPLSEEVSWTNSIQSVYDFSPEAIFVPGNIVPYYLPGVKIQVFHGYAAEKKDHWVIRRYFDTYFTQGPFFSVALKS